MRIYFVRHGESEANKKRIEQGAGGPLSSLGRTQAEYVGRRFTGAPIDLVISSSFERARQTAEILNKYLKKDLVYSDLFIERLPPSSIIGKPLHDPPAESV